MVSKLEITKALAWIAFVVYVIGVFVPYVEVWWGKFSVAQTLSNGFFGFLIPLIFIIPLIILFTINHTKTSGSLTQIITILFVIFSVIMTLIIVNSGRLLLGYGLHILSAILFLIASIIKSSIPVSNKTKIEMSNELIDDLRHGNL